MPRVYHWPLAMMILEMTLLELHSWVQQLPDEDIEVSADLRSQRCHELLIIGRDLLFLPRDIFLSIALENRPALALLTTAASSLKQFLPRRFDFAPPQ